MRTHARNRLPYLQRRIARLTRKSDQLETLSKSYWRARRAIFLSGALLALLVLYFAGGSNALILALLFIALFSGVVVYHNRVLESIRRYKLFVQLNNVQVARIQLDWQQMPATEILQSDKNHPFETDIDLTGDRSLHRLLDTTVTLEGSRRLRSWLLNTVPDQPTIIKRQSLVRELTGLSLFRDKLHLYAAIVSSDEKRELRQALSVQNKRWESHTLVNWLDHSVPQASLLPTLLLLSVIAAVNILLFVLANIGLIPHLWPLTFLIYVAVMILKQGRITRAWGDVQELEKALRRFGTVFRYLETRRCDRLPALAQVCAPFCDTHKRPSTELRALERIATALGVRTNALLWLLVHAFVPWDFLFTYRLEKLKSEIGELLPRWLDAWYELEALNSVANFAWLNPQYVFAELVTDEYVFEAEALGHPLIIPEQKICNDFKLDRQRRIIILTGSNMAGKSTFLRTIGVNLCLAFTGAPVNAKRLQTSLFRLFTCIKVSDSVQDGLSYFYAEVRRLKLLLSAVESQEDLPVLFLIDEIFRGTNNRERHIGSAAFIRAIANHENAFGLIATHDLELTKLADRAISEAIANFHFREEVREGRMIFDYLLHPGPCPTTNALTIMRLEGLPVDI